MAKNTGGLTRQQRRALQRANVAELQRKEASPPPWHERLRSGTRLFLGSAILALVVGLTTAAFSVATVFLAHVFIVMAFAVSALGLTILEWFWFSRVRFVILFLSLLLVGCVFLEIDKFIVYNSPEDPYAGKLVAGNEPRKIDNKCVNKNDNKLTAVYVGPFTSLFSAVPHTIIKMADRNILSLDRNSNGELLIHVEVFDTTGVRLICE